MSGRPTHRWLNGATVLRVLQSRTVRVLFILATVALLALALVDQGSLLRHDVGKLSVSTVILAFVLCVAGLVCSLMVWRCVLADLGSRLHIGSAWRINFVGQLGKYLPGSVWPVLAEMELGAQRKVPRGRSAVSVLLASAVQIFTGCVVAAVVLPFSGRDTTGRYLWVLALVPVGLVMLSPPVLNRMMNLALRLVRRPPMTTGMSVRGLLVSAAWGVLYWLLNGVMVYALMGRFAGHGFRVALVSTGAYALSWVAGYLAIFAPAGAGVREAVMVALLSTQTRSGTALLVALVARALSVVADGLTGAVGIGLLGRTQLRLLREARTAPAPPPEPGGSPSPG
ncbi:MAG: flippase-like domain-containing protein [Acidimicrobiaceae bacterium]|nr:flippase-like domain-containing protein [Acidimicrobiaceae bacterium]